MKSVIATIAVCSALLFVAQATRVQRCDTGEDYEDTERIKISNCDEPACKLKRKTVTIVEFRFTPETTVKSAVNRVSASIAGIPFPFIGVDGTNACETIFNVDGSKAACPLAAGTEYIYRNQFKILEIYPKIKLTVNWALVDGQSRKNVVCFDVDAKITS